MRHLLPLLVSSLLILPLGGCKTRSPQPGGGGSPAAYPDIASVIHGIALWASGLAALALLASIFIGLFVSRHLGFKIAAAALVTLIGAQALYWFGTHIVLLTWLVVIVGVLGLGVWVWRHIETLETRLGWDLNRDGVIGPKT